MCFEKQSKQNKCMKSFQLRLLHSKCLSLGPNLGLLCLTKKKSMYMNWKTVHILLPKLTRWWLKEIFRGVNSVLVALHEDSSDNIFIVWFQFWGTISAIQKLLTVLLFKIHFLLLYKNILLSERICVCSKGVIFATSFLWKS